MVVVEVDDIIDEMVKESFAIMVRNVVVFRVVVEYPLH